MSTEVLRSSKKGISKTNPFKKDIPFFILLLPALAVVTIFSYVPMFGIILAFKENSYGGGLLGAPWAANFGFENFIKIFSTKDMLDAIWNTFFLNILGLVISFPAPLIFAILLNEIQVKVFKKTVQTISYLPYFLSWISVTGLVSALFAEYGAITFFFKSVFDMDIAPLKNPSFFIPLYVFLSVWKSVGWGSIIYLANISSIDMQLYEAAQIDGAGHMRQVIHITLPSLIPTTMILLILSLGQMFGSNFDLVFGLQSVYFEREVIGTVVYKQGLLSGNYGLSTALSLMQGIIAVILTFGANALSRKVSQTSLF